MGTTRAKHAWPMVRLGDVCDFVYGFPFNSNFFNDEGDGKPLIRIRDVVPGVTNTFTTEPAPSKYDVSDGDLLVGMDGDFNLAQWAGGPALLNQRVCMFKPKPDALSVGFLKHSLGKYLKAIWDKKPFATVKHLSAKDLNAIFLPLPSLPVQREIVTRLERELAEADSLAANFKRIAELADAEFKAELDETFRRVEGERVRLGDVCETISTRGHQIKQCEIFSSGQYPVVSQSEKFIEGYSDREIVVDENEVVLFGDHTCCVKYIDFPFIVGADGTKILKSDAMIMKYLALALMYLRPMIDDGKYRRHFSDLIQHGISLPSLSTQCSIVSQMDTAKSRCEKLKTTAANGLRASETLRAAILSEAFAP